MSRHGNHCHWGSRRRTRSSGQTEGQASNMQFKDYWTKMAGNFEALRAKSKFCDVQIRVGDQCFNAHRVILSASSSYFEAMFSTGLKEEKLHSVELHDVEPKIFELLLQFTYTGDLKIEEGNVQELLTAANMLRLEPVVHSCCSFLSKQLDKSNCIGIFLFAEMHSCTILKLEAKRFVERHFTDVIREEEFLDLPKDALKNFLRSEGLSIYSEFEVFEATVKWILKDPSSRRSFLHELMDVVRLPVISTKQIEDCINECPHRELQKDLQDLFSTYKEESKRFHSEGALLVPSHLDLCDAYMNVRCQPRMSCRKSVYVIGGVTQAGNRWNDGRTLATVEKLDTFKRQWKSMQPMRSPRSCHGTALLQNRIYIAGGESDSLIYKSVEVLDPINDEWSVAADMLQPRSCFGMCAVQDYIYAFGGCIGSTVDASVERYDFQRDVWEDWGDMRIHRFAMGACAHNGLIYIVGGFDEYTCVQSSCFAYNPVTKHLRQLKSMFQARAHFGIGLLHGFIYVVGGTNGRTTLSSVERYSIADNKWTRVADMQRQRVTPCVASIQNTLLVVGGRDAGESTMPHTLDTVEIYDPEQNKWRDTLAMPTSRCEAAATVL